MDYDRHPLNCACWGSYDWSIPKPHTHMLCNSYIFVPKTQNNKTQTILYPFCHLPSTFSPCYLQKALPLLLAKVTGNIIVCKGSWPFVGAVLWLWCLNKTSCGRMCLLLQVLCSDQLLESRGNRNHSHKADHSCQFEYFTAIGWFRNYL